MGHLTYCSDCTDLKYADHIPFYECAYCNNKVCSDCVEGNSCYVKYFEIWVKQHKDEYSEDDYNEEYNRIFGDIDMYGEDYEPTYQEIFEVMSLHPLEMSQYFICHRCISDEKKEKELEDFKEKIFDLEDTINKLKVLLVSLKTNKDVLKKIYNYL